MHRLALAWCAVLFVLAGPTRAAAIGVAMAERSFRIDSHPVAGNTTLFEGNPLETTAATPELRLYGGALFQDRLALEMRMAEVEGGNAYRIEAHGQPLPPEAKDAATARQRGRSGARKGVIAGVVVGGAGAAAAVYLVSKKTNDQGTVSPSATEVCLEC